MLASSVPAKIPEPWAKNASGTPSLVTNPMPDTVSSGTGLGSWQLGWQAINDIPAPSGGIPPFMRDFNGVLFPVSGWAQWFSMGGPVVWDSTFSSTIGGYPKGALVQSAVTFGTFWLCTAENNMTNPDASGAGWINYLNRGSSLTANGYRTNTDGSIDQWGTSAAIPTGGSSTANITITFPIPFPNACFVCQGVGDRGANGSWGVMNICTTAQSQTNATFHCDSANPSEYITNTVHVVWRAVGW